MPGNPLLLEDFSELIGAIYDCALNPQQWPRAIAGIGHATRCEAGMITVVELPSGAPALAQAWNYEPAWLARMAEYRDEVAMIWQSVPNLMSRPLDEPMTASRDAPFEDIRKNRWFREMIEPLGYYDTIQLMLLRRKDRIGSLGLSYPARLGVVSDRDLDVMRLLAPHIRRAVSISDVLEMQALSLAKLDSVLDRLKAGVVLLDQDCKAIHLNAAAKAMMTPGGPLALEHGDLVTREPQSSTALRQSVASINGGELAIGRSGIGIPVEDALARRSLLYVLPLVAGAMRPHIAANARAALFISAESAGETFPVEALAALFALSPAEQRTLERLLLGRNPTEIATDLGIAMPTVRSHLASLFAKSGTSGQAELIRLARQLSPPVRTD